MQDNYFLSRSLLFVFMMNVSSCVMAAQERVKGLKRVASQELVAKRPHKQVAMPAHNGMPVPMIARNTKELAACLEQMYTIGVGFRVFHFNTPQALQTYLNIKRLDEMIAQAKQKNEKKPARRALQSIPFLVDMPLY